MPAAEALLCLLLTRSFSSFAKVFVGVCVCVCVCVYIRVLHAAPNPPAGHYDGAEDSNLT